MLLVGCGKDDPVSHSAPVGINLKAKGDEVRNSVIVADKNINTESGNPYGAFTSEAQRILGRAPGRIEIDKVELLLAGSSQGVTALEQVLSGRVDVQFVMNDTNNTFPAAHVTDPKGAGPVKMSVDFDSGKALGDDYAKLVGGGFKVVLRSNAAAGTTFAGRKDAVADLQVTFTFSAFE